MKGIIAVSISLSWGVIINKMMLIYILIATGAISLISLVGFVLLSKTGEFLNRIVFLLVGLSTGTLLGGAFFHLLPESLEHASIPTVLNTVLISFIIFFFLEKLLHWRHCHNGECEVHDTFGHLNLIGDAIHNFIDGIIIAGAFSVDIRLGVVTTLALAFHEIPQELSDFGVLIYSGFSRGKAIFYNFLVALTSVAGGAFGYIFLSSSEIFLSYLLPIAAGGFLYISTSDLIPELRKETNLKKSRSAFLLFILGVVLMYLLTYIE